MGDPPFDPAEIPAGTWIGNKYVLGAPLGFGEHSVVYQAEHILLRRPCAVKVLASAMSSRFAREARLAASLRNPHVVELYDVGNLPNGRPYLVLEFLRGETVGGRLARLGAFSVIDAIRFARQILSGLAAAHEQSIVHRDVTPENLLLTVVRGVEVVKILDLGAALDYESASDTLTAPGTVLGDMSYHAPEQLVMYQDVDHRADIYATGVTLYEMLTSKRPITAKGTQLILAIMENVPAPASTHRPELSTEIDRILATALQKKPEDRFQSADQMSDALREAALFADYLGSR